MRRLRFGTTLTPEVQAAILQADAAAKQGQAHASEALRNQALAREAVAGARDAVQKARAKVRGYASQAPQKQQGGTVFAYEGQTNRDGAPEGLEVVNFGGGNSYEGEWKGGVPEGYGIMTYSGGRVHAGKWEKGVNVGDGITTAGGLTWEGELFDTVNLKSVYWGVLFCDASEACLYRAGPFEISTGAGFNLNGSGVVMMRNGQQIKGFWKHGVQDGEGAQLDAKGGMQAQGNYRNGQL